MVDVEVVEEDKCWEWWGRLASAEDEGRLVPPSEAIFSSSFFDNEEGLDISMRFFMSSDVKDSLCCIYLAIPVLKVYLLVSLDFYI